MTTEGQLLSAEFVVNGHAAAEDLADCEARMAQVLDRRAPPFTPFSDALPPGRDGDHQDRLDQRLAQLAYITRRVEAGDETP